MSQKLTELLVTFFYSGKASKAPGTVGTLATLPLWYLMSHYLGPYLYMAITILLVIGAMMVCEIYERQSKTHDSSHIVIDEVVGFLITMTWLPETLKSCVFGFVLFRLLDIWKPFPIRLLDRKVQGGVGVVIDDVAAGIIANFLLQVAFYNGLLN